MMRIGYVIWSLGLGGAEQVVIRLALACARRGHAVTIFTLNEAGVFAEQVQAAGLAVVPMEKRGPYDLSIVPRLAREFRARQLDVVHTHLWGANLWGRLAAHRARVPVVVATEHNVDTWKRGHHFLIDRFLMRWTTAFIAVSHEVRAFYEAHGVARGRWQVIYNGIDAASALPRGRGNAYQALGITPQEPVVGLIGRLVPSKAPGVFLEAIAEASRRVPSVKGLVVGEGPLRAEVEARIEELGLSGRVLCTGLRQDVPELLAGMDVLAFSSEREGLSMAMLEAMAAGVPVAATQVGGTPELIESGLTGILVPAGDAQKLATAITELLTDQTRAEAIRRTARRRVEQAFSFDRMVSAHEALYANSRTATRICYLIDHLGAGGAQRQLVELVRRLPRDRWEPLVVSLSTDDTPLAAELRESGVQLCLMPQRGAMDAACLWRLTRLLRQFRPALVHTFLFTADTYGRLAARLAGVRHAVCAIRNTLDDMPTRQRMVNRWLAPWTSCITVNAEAIRAGLIREGGIPERKLRTIYNGIEPDAPPGQPNGWYRRQWAVPEGAPVVAMVARLSPQKDHRTFLAAAKRVLEAVPQAHFLLIGDGPLRRAVERWVDDFGLSRRARVLGERDDVRQLLSSVDLCVLASHFEGCSNAIMEAMASGKPVVASDVGGNRELIVEGQTGLLVPPRDPDALAQAMVRLLADPPLRQAMGERGKARIAERFTIEAAVERTQALYRELVNPGGSTR